MLIKLNLIGMKINRSNQNEYDDPILRRIKEGENNENEKKFYLLLLM